MGPKLLRRWGICVVEYLPLRREGGTLTNRGVWGITMLSGVVVARGWIGTDAAGEGLSIRDYKFSTGAQTFRTRFI